MKNFLEILFVVLIIILSGKANAENLDKSVYAHLDSLDALITKHDLFEQQRENEIQKIKVNSENLSPYQRFELNDSIFNAYLAFNPDSALKYANENLILARQLNDKKLEIRANIKISYAYSSTGQLNGAMEVLNGIDKNDITQDLKIEYFGHLCHIYARLAEYSDKRDSMRGHYYNKEFMYADSVLDYMPPTDEYYLVYRGWRDQRQGNVPQLIDDLERHFSINQNDSYINSQLLYLLANLYKVIDSDKYLNYLIDVAEMDIKIANSDSRAFTDLANELFRRGKTEEAHKYISYGLDLALMSNNRVRMVSMIEDMNKIQQENFKIQQLSNLYLRKSLWGLGGMALLLIIAIILIVNQFRKLSVQRKKESTLNDRLNDTNAKLNDTNAKLHDSNLNLSNNIAELTRMHKALKDAKTEVDKLNNQLIAANKALQEQNSIKEEYIGFVLLLCSDYLSKLDEYRKNIRRKVNTGKFDDLRQFTDSPLLMQKEIKEFHKSFDAIFLRVFPTFVDDFNSLLQPDQRFVLKDNYTLNTDLRIFALMHLGITDSGKIADFLHISLQTVYNSRLKTRGKAIKRESFDSDIQNFGK